MKKCSALFSIVEPRCNRKCYGFPNYTNELLMWWQDCWGSVCHQQTRWFVHIHLMPISYVPDNWLIYLQVENLVLVELAYINTKHPDFHKDATLVSSMMHAHIDDTSSQKLAVKQVVKKHSFPTPTSQVNGETLRDLVRNCWICYELTKWRDSFGKQSRPQRAASVIDPPAGAAGSWLSNLLPNARSEITESSAENSPNMTPTHQPNSLVHGPFSPQKPVNLLSEPVAQTGRKLSDREQRDCEVIGWYFLLLLIFNIYSHYVGFFSFRLTIQRGLLSRIFTSYENRSKIRCRKQSCTSWWTTSRITYSLN